MDLSWQQVLRFFAEGGRWAKVLCMTVGIEFSEKLQNIDLEKMLNDK